MKTMRTALLLLTLALAASVSAQTLTGYGVVKNFGVTQTSSSAPTAGATPYWLNSYVFGAGLTTGYTFTSPSGSALSPQALAGNSSSFSFDSINFSSLGLFNGAYGNGVYTMTLPNTVVGPPASQTASLPTLIGDLYPNAPTVTGTWSGGLLQVDPTVNYTLTFAAFSGFTVDDSISMNVENSSFVTVSSGFSGGTAVTSFVITAGQLTAGQIYDVSLRFNNNFIDYATTIAGANGNAGYTTENFFQIQAIPEPSTYAAIFGGLALAGAMIYRRRRIA